MIAFVLITGSFTVLVEFVFSIAFALSWILSVSTMKYLSILIAALLTVAFVHAAPALKSPPIGVPADALFFKNKWYKIYFAKASWTTAKDKCKIVGGQLAAVPDKDTNKFLQKLAGQSDVWLGASDEKAEGQWVWTDGSPMEFSAWGEGQPDNLANRQHFLHMKQGLWDDTFRDERLISAFICEWSDR